MRHQRLDVVPQEKRLCKPNQEEDSTVNECPLGRQCNKKTVVWQHKKTHTHTHTHTHTNTDIYIHIDMYTHQHTHTYTYIVALTLPSSHTQTNTSLTQASSLARSPVHSNLLKTKKIQQKVHTRTECEYSQISSAKSLALPLAVPQRTLSPFSPLKALPSRFLPPTPSVSIHSFLATVRFQIPASLNLPTEWK